VRYDVTAFRTWVTERKNSAGLGKTGLALQLINTHEKLSLTRTAFLNNVSKLFESDSKLKILLYSGHGEGFGDSVSERTRAQEAVHEVAIKRGDFILPRSAGETKKEAGGYVSLDEIINMWLGVALPIVAGDRVVITSSNHKTARGEVKAHWGADGFVVELEGGGTAHVPRSNVTKVVHGYDTRVGETIPDHVPETRQRRGQKLVIIADSCYSGALIDTLKNVHKDREKNKRPNLNIGVQASCAARDKAVDGYFMEAFLRWQITEPSAAFDWPAYRKQWEEKQREWGSREDKCEECEKAENKWCDVCLEWCTTGIHRYREDEFQQPGFFHTWDHTKGLPPRAGDGDFALKFLNDTRDSDSETEE